MPLAVLVLCLSVSGLSRAGKVTYKSERNLPYSAEPLEQQTEYQKERCKLDVYYPQGRKGFATVVWYHGGGLINGSKHYPGLRDQCLALVGANYRLHPKVPCATSISDAAAALAWIFKNIEKYGGDPSLIFVSGSSAGGYLTSMVGFDKRWLAKYGVDADDIKGLIPYTGHTITHMTVRKEHHNLSCKIPLIDEFAPIYHARAGAPPVLLLTGDRDLEYLGRCEENELFYRVLKNVGHPNVEHMEFEGYGHPMSHPANPVALKWITKIIGCSPEALIVPLDHTWDFTKRDRKYTWRASGADPLGEPKPSLEYLSSGGRNGSGCLAVRDGSAAGNAYARSSTLPVRSGKGYVLSGWARNEGSGEGVAGACLNIAEGRSVKKQVKAGSFPVTTEWSRFELAFAPFPKGALGLALFILPRAPGQPAAATGSVLFDDLQIREQSVEPQFGD